MFSNDDAMVAALKAHDIDAIEAVPATAIKTLQERRLRRSLDVPRRGSDGLHLQLQSEEAEPSRAAEPQGQGGVRPRRRPRTRSCRVVFLGGRNPPTRSSRRHRRPLARPAAKTDESYNLAHANKILDHLGYKQGSGGIRVAQGRRCRMTWIAPTDVHSIQDVPDPSGRIPQDRRPAPRESARLERGLRRDDGPGGKYLNFDLALWDWVGARRPRLHALGVDVCAVRRLEGHRVLRQDVRRMYSKQQLTPDQTNVAPSSSGCRSTCTTSGRTSGSRTTTR